MCRLFNFALDIDHFRPLLSLRHSERRGRSLVVCTTVV